MTLLLFAFAGDGDYTSPPAKTWPYTTILVAVPSLAIVGVIALLILRPGEMNAALVAQILGFGVTITMATMAYMKSSETHAIVNSRMDEFKRALEETATAAAFRARTEGQLEGRKAADQRTDALARDKL